MASAPAEVAVTVGITLWMSSKEGKIKLIVCYRDQGGVVAVEVDHNGIDFADGKAFFNCDGAEKDFIIPIESLVAVKETDT